MDVIFEPQNGKPFTIEVGFFDTVLEIKAKIQKYHQIPIPKQTLIFNGQVLQDDGDVEFCEILHNSHIQLIVAFEPEKSPVVKLIDNSSLPKKIHLDIKIPSHQISFAVDMDSNDSIARLKERIRERENFPVDRLTLQSDGGAELQDHQSLREYELSDNSVIEVSLRPLPATTSAMAATTGSSKKLIVLVQPQCGGGKIAMEVNALDSVGEMKKELEKLQHSLKFHLPSEGFFFIYDRDVMDETRSFRWHGVSQGDTIEIFNGSVTGGS